MDISRAKTILIIAFILLNTYLGYSYWVMVSSGSDVTYATAEETAQVREVLEREGIILDTTLDRKVMPQPFLVVSYNKVDPQKVVRHFFEDQTGLEYESNSDSIVYKSGAQQLMIMNNGIISYFDNSDEPANLESFDPETARRVAEEFIEKHGGLPANAEFDRTVYYNESNSYLVEYIQVYKGRFLAGSYIDVLVTPAGVKSYYFSWQKPIGYSGKAKKIISPVHALLKMIDIIAGSDVNVVVKDVELGYYSRYYNAEKWQAVPVWRIALEGDDYYYINGYTGELEQ
jgi:regulatory protein YycI of two-component signal transduction system YycFG